MQRMRSHYDPERSVLPLRELREHERVFLRGLKIFEMAKIGLNHPRWDLNEQMAG